MFVTDFLYKDYIDNCGIEDKSINYYVHIINTKKAKFCNEKFKEFQTERMRDPILSKILLYYKFNWPRDNTKLLN